MKNTCPVCNKPIRGRSDKRFCSSTCKNAYHNTLRRNSLVNKLDHQLHRNRSILLQLISKPETKELLYRKTLDQFGFDYEVVTGFCVTPEGDIKRMVYEFIWSENEDGNLVVELSGTMKYNK